MSAVAAVRVRCPGKVNLHLEVLGRRGDGYHELRTLFAAVGVWDELLAQTAPEGELALTVEPSGAVSAGDDNLVLRAARSAAAAWGCRAGARIRLHKRIPVGGGMGGGSSDAAAALVALAALWRPPFQASNLGWLAASLGSDVPFFLVAGAAWGSGRGTELRPLPDLPPWWLVLLPGEEPVSTGEVYASLGLGSVEKVPRSPVYDWSVGGGVLPLGACRNDLEPTVVARWPLVGRRVQALKATGPLLAMVSGSGGTVFAVYPGEERAIEVAERLGSYRPMVAALLNRDGSILRPMVVEEA